MDREGSNMQQHMLFLLHTLQRVTYSLSEFFDLSAKWLWCLLLYHPLPILVSNVLPDTLKRFIAYMQVAI
jgi:hypothetical protein